MACKKASARSNGAVTANSYLMLVPLLARNNIGIASVGEIRLKIDFSVRSPNTMIVEHEHARGLCMLTISTYSHTGLANTASN